jgi:single-strand DNA-binding protein
MPSANATLYGNLTDSPELKFTASGQALATFTVACNHSWKNGDGEWEKQVSYIDVTAWRDLAEEAASVLEKGSNVIVSGRLEQQSWDDKETGKKRSKIIVIADSISLNVRSIESVTRKKFEGDGKGQKAKPAAQPKRQASQEEEPF